MKIKVEKQTFEDASIVTYLSLRNFKIIPQRTDIGRVVFVVEGPNITEALQEIYQNKKVGVLDFIKTLKVIRSSIYTLKGGGR
jgi:hypothetical protein